MTTIEELRKKRFQFLNLLYEKTGGDESNFVRMWDLGSELGYEKNETQTIAQYLEREGLMKYATLGGGIAITHDGVREVEKALSHPEQSTHYFPPVNIIIINHMEGSQIQQGNISSNQSGSFTLSDPNDIMQFLELLIQKLPELGLGSDDEAKMKSDISTIESQVVSSHPETSILKESLLSIQRILEGAGGAIVAQQLLPYVPAILAILK